MAYYAPVTTAADDHELVDADDATTRQRGRIEAVEVESLIHNARMGIGTIPSGGRHITVFDVLYKLPSMDIFVMQITIFLYVVSSKGRGEDRAAFAKRWPVLFVTLGCSAVCLVGVAFRLMIKVKQVVAERHRVSMMHSAPVVLRHKDASGHIIDYTEDYMQATPHMRSCTVALGLLTAVSFFGFEWSLVLACQNWGTTYGSHGYLNAAMLSHISFVLFLLCCPFVLFEIRWRQAASLAVCVAIAVVLIWSGALCVPSGCCDDSGAGTESDVVSLHGCGFVKVS